MKGTTIRSILLVIKLLSIFVIFLLASQTFCESVNSYVWYNLATFTMTLLTFLYCFNSNYIEFRNNKKTSKIIKKISTLNMKECENYPIYYSNEKFKNYLFDLLDKISDKQKDVFKDKGYLIVIGTKDELKKISKIKNITGLFSHYEKYILLYIDENTTEDAFESTFYHEWGHFVDYYNNYYSNTINFKKIFSKEKQAFNYSIRFLYSNNLPQYLKHHPHITMYELTSASEYFAVNYSKYKRNTLRDKRLIEIYNKVESRWLINGFHCVYGTF